MEAVDHSRASVVLRLAGTPQADLREGRETCLLAGRDAALLTWLALEGPTPRARLGVLLWPGSTAEAARNALRQRLLH